MMPNKALSTLVVLSGPTGVGKTDFAISVAKEYHTSIIGCDSRQFYKELQIGTSPPSISQLKTVPHYFVQFLSIHDYYNVSLYEQDVLNQLNSLFTQQPVVFLVGGSGLYIDAVCSGIDDMPDYDSELRQNLVEQLHQKGITWLRTLLQQLDMETYKKIDLNNKNRVLRAVEVCLLTGKPYSSFLKNEPKKRNFNVLKIMLTLPREQLYQRINQRVNNMIQEGLEAEAHQLFPYRDLTALKTVGYKELFDYFDGKTTLTEAIELIKQHTRHYARKQQTWFRRDQQYQWFDINQPEEIKAFIRTHMVNIC